MKNYYCYWDVSSSYYGINAHWQTCYGDYDYCNISDDVTGRARVILELKALLKYDDYQKKYLPSSEFMDFIDKLSNNLNGEDLYKNFCENCEYLDYLGGNAFEQCMYDKFSKVFYPKFGYSGYMEGCALRIFDENVNNLLKNPKEFETFVQKTIYNKDKILYCSLFDVGQSKQNIIKYFEEHIESFNKNIKFYEKEIENYKKKIKNMEIELEKLK